LHVAVGYFGDALARLHGILVVEPQAPCTFARRCLACWAELPLDQVAVAIGQAEEDGQALLELVVHAGIVAMSTAALTQDKLGLYSESPNATAEACLRLRRMEQLVVAVFELVQGMLQERSWHKVAKKSSFDDLFWAADVRDFWVCVAGRALRCSVDDLVLTFEHQYEQLIFDDRARFARGLAGEGQEVSIVTVLRIFEPCGVHAGFLWLVDWTAAFSGSVAAAIVGDQRALRVSTAADLAREQKEIASAVRVPGVALDSLLGSLQKCMSLMSVLEVTALAGLEDGATLSFLHPEDAGVLTNSGSNLCAIATDLGLPIPVHASQGPATAAKAQCEDRYAGLKAEDKFRALGSLFGRQVFGSREMSMRRRGVDALYRAAMARKMVEAPVVDSSTHSPAWGKMQDALQSVRQLEDRVRQRKEQLLEMEMVSGDQVDQVAHIRVLLEEVVAAEEERDQTRRRFQQHQEIWVEEETAFLREKLEVAREHEERVALAGLEVEQMCGVTKRIAEERSKIEKLLLGYEEEFAKFRRHLHAYDQELTTTIGDKEAYLDSLNQHLGTLASAVRTAERRTADREQEMAELQKVLSLDIKKDELQAQISRMEARLEGLNRKYRKAQSRVNQGQQ